MGESLANPTAAVRNAARHSSKENEAPPPSKSAPLIAGCGDDAAVVEEMANKLDSVMMLRRTYCSMPPCT